MIAALSVGTYGRYDQMPSVSLSCPKPVTNSADHYARACVLPSDFSIVSTFNCQQFVHYIQVCKAI